MNKRLLPAITIGIAVLVIGTFAYAADRKKNAKATSKYSDAGQDDALQKELLNALDLQEKKPAASNDTKFITTKTSADNKAAITAKTEKK